VHTALAKIKIPGASGGGGSGGGPCLIKDTLITMADGSQEYIQNVEVGDEILAYDFENNMTTTAIVMAMDPTKLLQQAHYTVLSDGRVLCTTRGHNFYCVEYGRSIPIEDLREGQHLLNEKGEEVEIMAIHWDVEMKTYGQFYHLVSSNNTYFANGIMNAAAPIDKYRYLHDLTGMYMANCIQDLILDESKDTACMNFTVSNLEFVKKGTPYQYKIKKARNRIWELETLIKDMDKDIAKANAGIPVDYDVATLKAGYYEEIEQLQAQMKQWEAEYSKLLVEYSDLGEDILLVDQDRREKYFKRANKLANDNYEMYKFFYEFVIDEYSYNQIQRTDIDWIEYLKNKE
jgi:hypothetical protein